MEDGELCDRVGCFPAGIVNEDAPFRNRCHHAVVEEVVHEMTSCDVGEIGCRLSSVAVLDELLSLKSLVVGARTDRRAHRRHCTRA